MNQFQQELCDQIKRFRLDQIEPTASHDDEHALFRQEIYQGLSDLGLSGMTVPEEWGGLGLGQLDLCYALMEVAKSSVSYAVTLSVSSMVQSILVQFGSEKQKQTYLPSLISGKEIGAFALTESSSGSDAAALKTTAKKIDGGYILNGSKMFITSAGIAKTYIVMARTGGEGAKGISSFIVRDGTAGFSYGKKEKKMGWRVSPTGELIFNNCFIPEENLLSLEGKGFQVAMSALDKGRMTIGAIAVGLSERAIEEAVHYALGRTQFNSPLFEFQGLQFMLAEMSTETEASKLLVDRSAQLYDLGRPDQMLASMAKLKATDTCMDVTTNAVHIFGGVGYTCEYPVERFMRDAKVLQIVEGANQIQKIVIARNLKKKFGHS